MAATLAIDAEPMSGQIGKASVLLNRRRGHEQIELRPEAEAAEELHAYAGPIDPFFCTILQRYWAVQDCTSI